MVITIIVAKEGELKSGWSENAPGQSKILANQMSNEEIKYLGDLLKEIKTIYLHPHLQWKRDTGQLSFDTKTIDEVFESGELDDYIKEFSCITLRCGRTDHRVLVRSPRAEVVNVPERGLQKCNLMFVVSLDTEEIITAYYVHIDNQFDKPNMARYDARLDVIALLNDHKRIVEPVKEEKPPLDDLTLDEWLAVFE